MARKVIKSISRNSKIYLSLYYASSLCGYHKDYLGQLIRRGKLSAEKFGNTWFIDEDIFKRFREQNSTSVEKPVNLDKSLEFSSTKADPSALSTGQAGGRQDPWDQALLGEDFRKPGSGEKEPITIPLRIRISSLSRLSLKPLVFATILVLSGFWIWQHPELPSRVYTNLEHASRKAVIISGALLHQTLLEVQVVDIKVVFTPIQQFLEMGPLAVGKQVGSWFSEKGGELVERSSSITKRFIGFSFELPNLPSFDFFSQKKEVLTPEESPEIVVKEDSPSETLVREEVESLRSQGFQTQPQINEETIVQRAIQKILSGLPAEVLTKAGLSQQELDLAIQALNNKFLNEIAQLKNLVSSRANANFQAIALTNKIDSLSNVTLSSPTITGGTFNLTDGDVPDDITLNTTKVLTVASTATSTIAGLTVFTKVPSIAHAFGSWSPGVATSSILNSSLLINPASAENDTVLLAIAVNDASVFMVDAEGDVFVRNLTATGTVNQADTTMSSLTVENATTLGDAIGDTVTFNAGTLVFATTSTSTIPEFVNAWSIATSTTITPIFSIDGLNGRVGIGTSSPAFNLHLEASASTDHFVISNNTSGKRWSLNSIDDTTDFFSIGEVAAAHRLVVQAGGNVGIGTTSPTHSLDVFGQANGTGIRLRQDLTGPSLTLNAYSAQNNVLFVDDQPATLGSAVGASLPNEGSYNGRLVFSTFSSPTWSERMRITNAGNVGIGTTSPYSLLSLKGSSGAQISIAQADTNFTELTVDALGDLTITPSGNTITIPDDNLRICSGGACPSVSLSGTGHLIIENDLYLGGDIARPSCRTGYLLVTGSSTLSTKDFCVMKYEAKLDANKNPESVAAGTPQASIDWHEARQACWRVGARLLTPNERMTIAYDIASTTINDMDDDSGIQLATGQSDNVPSNSLASSAGADPVVSGCDLGATQENSLNAYVASSCEIRGTGSGGSTDNDKGYYGTEQTWSTTGYVAGNANKSQMRTHVLSNGNVIWDFAGNVWDWTDQDMTALGIWHDSSGAWIEWSDANLTDYEQIVAGPFSGDTSVNGTGKYLSSAGARAGLRGGSYFDSQAGVFAMALNTAPSVASVFSGFRCAY